MSLPEDGAVVIVPLVIPTEVNVPAAGVVAPIDVPFTVPPVIATEDAFCVDIVPRPVMSVLGMVAEPVNALVPLPFR